MWEHLLEPRLTLLDGRAGELVGFFQELAHHGLQAGAGKVLWCDGDHGFNPHEFAEVNLTRGHAAEEGGECMLIKRCMTPFQWYTTLSRLLPEKIRAAPTRLAIVNPFDRQFSTDELADWEQEDYVRFLIPHLKAVARQTGVPILLGVDMQRWWRTHPSLAQLTRDGVDERWSVSLVGGRWRCVRDDGTVLDPMLRHATTLLDYLDQSERPVLVVPPTKRRLARARRTRIIHREAKP
ncbi:MAG: hypothetical protein LC623_05050 [Halobacteriales archaeon]|nr:hypothetical protein [Halobacteriales archaeon]